MAKIAILFLIFIFLQVEKLQAKYQHDILPDIDVENTNDLDQYDSNYYETQPSEGHQLSNTVFLEKMSPNSDESQNEVRLDQFNLAMVNSGSDNDIYHHDIEDNTIQKTLERSKLFQRLVRKAEFGNDLHENSMSGPYKIPLLKTSLKKIKTQGNDKQSRILEDIRKLNSKEKEALKMKLQREAPQNDILQMISLQDDEEKVTPLKPEEILGDTIKVEVNLEKDENNAEDSNTSNDLPPTLIIEPSPEDITPKSSEIPNPRALLNLDILQKTRNHMLNTFKPVPESDFSPNYVNCDVYCYRQYYLHFGNNYYCCVQYDKNNYQFNFNSQYQKSCLQQCNCCVQNHYVQQTNFVQQNYSPEQQHYGPVQQHYVPSQQHYGPVPQHYGSAQQHYYLPVQQHYLSGQQHYQQNPTNGNYYWPYIYDRLAHTY